MLFLGTDPSLDAYWRSIILFGSNTTAYKFALGSALLSVPATSEVALTELAKPFALALAAHLKEVRRQGTNPTNAYLAACLAFNDGQQPLEELIDKTVSLGFRYVLDRFHIVNGGQLPVRFYDPKPSKGTLVLTDALLGLRSEFQARNLPTEAEARWRLVETAWELRVPARTLSVKFDPDTEHLFIGMKSTRRITLTGCREALNGYQKGRCFYCCRQLALVGDTRNTEIDHFFPWVLNDPRPYSSADLNGVWNLVLACQQCNRGAHGKFARVPELALLERLHRRNSFLIDSHHPLRETLMAQTGASESQRIAFLQRIDQRASETLIHRWSPLEAHDPAF